MQLAFEDGVYLVDAIEGESTLMQACKPALESPYVTKVVHDCKRDSEASDSVFVSLHNGAPIICDLIHLWELQALYFQHGIRLHNVFDTQVNVKTLCLFSSRLEIKLSKMEYFSNYM